LIITVNYKKLDVCLRNERYLGLAQQNLPYATAEVYKCLLHHIELRTESCRKNRRIESGKSQGGQVFGAIGCWEILNDIEPSLDLIGSIGQSGNEISNDNLNRDQKKAQAIDEHLGLLAQPPYEFVFRVIEGGDIRWQIKFDDLSRKLLEKELERIICSRYGDLALRVIRILLAKGKIDTKCLQQTSLIPPEYLKKILNRMFAQGFVSVQEIPLPPPGKQKFLWYFDADRVSQQVLEDTYKCMSRTLQRLNLERRGYQALLDKASRSDVEAKSQNT
jgi:DNA-directed RNA polymerase III subunit RPC3